MSQDGNTPRVHRRMARTGAQEGETPTLNVDATVEPGADFTDAERFERERRQRAVALVLAGEDMVTAEAYAQAGQISQGHADTYRAEVTPLRRKLEQAAEAYERMIEDDGGDPNNVVSQVAQERLREVQNALTTLDQMAQLPGVRPESDPSLLGMPAMKRALKLLAERAESEAP